MKWGRGERGGHTALLENVVCIKFLGENQVFFCLRRELEQLGGEFGGGGS